MKPSVQLLIMMVIMLVFTIGVSIGAKIGRHQQKQEDIVYGVIGGEWCSSHMMWKAREENGVRTCYAADNPELRAHSTQ